MAKRKAKRTNPTTKKDSKLVQTLESGGDIAGLKGYILMGDSDDVYIKVKCVGLSTKDCGVGVLVTPMSGDGEFTITPCQWWDETQNLDELRDLHKRQEQAEWEFTQIANAHTQRMKKHRIHDFVSKTTAAVREETIEHALAEKLLSEPAAADGDLTKLKGSNNELHGLARVAVCLHFNLEGTEIPYNISRRC